MPAYKGFVYEELPDSRYRVTGLEPEALDFVKANHSERYQLESLDKTFGSLAALQSYVDCDMTPLYASAAELPYRWKHIQYDCDLLGVIGLKFEGRKIASAVYNHKEYNYTIQLEVYQLTYGSGYIIIHPDSNTIAKVTGDLNGQFAVTGYLESYGSGMEKDITWL